VNGVFRDVIRDGAFGDVRCAADVDETDAPLSDEPTHETRLGAENLGRLVAGQESF